MAVAVASVSTTTYTSATSKVVTKPTGLAVGDLMVAFVGYDDSSQSISAPGGWTELTTIEIAGGSGDYGNQSVFWKYAESADVAASDFTFSRSGAADHLCATIYRITGAGGSVTLFDADTFANTASPSFSGGVTPSLANSLLLISISAGDNVDSVNSVSITTSNPTWTEDYDISNGGATTQKRVLAGYSAVRPEDTATGNYGAGITTTGVTDGTGVIVSIAPAVNVTLSMPVGTVTLSGAAPTLVIGINLSMPVGGITLNGLAPTLNVSSSIWTKHSKGSATTWTPMGK